MIIYYFILKGIKQGSTNSYKIVCMAKQYGIKDTFSCSIEDFRGHFMNEEWLG